MANLQPQSDRSAGDVETHIAYLARDRLFLKEKPYGADFPVDHFKGAKLANHTFEKVPVRVRNARGREHDFTLERNGFCFLQAKTSLTAEEASNEKTPTMARYLEEIERILYKSFPEYARIEVMDFQVRKRHPGFPEAIGTRVEFEQPAAMPHTDFSVDGAYMRMREAFPGQEKHYERKGFDLLNVWRVLCGPNNDWPLGLCDFQSIDMERDTLPNDCLHQTRVGENWLLTSHKGHVWYYLSDQLETDLIIFRNTDSEGARAHFVRPPRGATVQPYICIGARNTQLTVTASLEFTPPYLRTQQAGSTALMQSLFARIPSSLSYLVRIPIPFRLKMTAASLAASSALAVRSSSSVVVGPPSNFWLFSNRHGFDMTHPSTPDAPLVYPRLTLTTSNSPVTIAPAKTALVIIDMQNFFLSAAMGRKRGEGHKAETVLLEQGIPAAREAGIQVIWLTWGISEAGIETLPPTVWRIFGWEIADDDKGFEVPAGADSPQGDQVSGPFIRVPERKSDGGIGSELGCVTLADGSAVDAGKMLLRDQWNTRLHGPLEEAFEAGQRAAVPDVRFHKERLSGLWGDAHSNELEMFLREKGLKTLLFAGVNTDQCVLATIQDASNKGFDTVLLRDGCGTTSPEYARQMVDFNCQKSWGFISSCEALARGVKGMVKEKPVDGLGRQ